MESAAAGVIGGYLKLCGGVTRWQVSGQAHLDEMLGRNGAFIYAFWHSRILLLMRLQALHGRPTTAMISHHKDGDVITKIAQSYGIKARRGSAADPRKKEKNKGGIKALKALVNDARAGINPVITPDGPRGPMQRAQPGVIQLARLSGVPILPLAYGYKFARRLNSWDRMMLPFPVPGAKGVLVYGEPIYVDAKDDPAIETARRLLEHRLNDITAEADRLCGHLPVLPPEETAEHFSLAAEGAP